MWMPCVVIITDDIGGFTEIMDEIYPLCKVYVRTSVQGEQLYQEREGVLFFDEDNHRQQVWRYDYTSLVTRVKGFIDKAKARSAKHREMIEGYQKRRK